MRKPDLKTARHGTIVVEAAIVLPVLLLLTLGAIEYGWLLLNAQRVTNIARQGARVAILPGSTATQVYGIIDAMLLDAHLSDDSPTRTATALPIPGDPEGRLGIEVVVTVSTANLAIVRAPALFPIPSTLRGKVTMAKEGG